MLQYIIYMYARGVYENKADSSHIWHSISRRNKLCKLVYYAKLLLWPAPLSDQLVGRRPGGSQGVSATPPHSLMTLVHELKVHKHEIFFLSFLAETETLWSQGPVTRDF
jgi:hypothetical protein